MALGGVATGSMKAKEALRVQGIITYSGFSFMDWDWERKHKRMIAPVPLLHTGLTCDPERVCVCPYHRGQDGQEERRSGNVARALSEDGDEEAEDDGDGPRRDGVEGRHLSAQPAGQSRHLNGKLSCKS